MTAEGAQSALVLALGLSFPSCTVKSLEFSIPRRFQVAVLWVCSGGVRGPVRVLLPSPGHLPRAQDHPSCLVSALSPLTIP